MIFQTVVVVLFATGMVAVSWLAYHTALEQARDGLTARLTDRALVLGRASMGHAYSARRAQKLVEAAHFDDGYVRYVNGAGQTLAASDAVHGAVPLPSPYNQGQLAPIALHETDAGDMEVCVHVTPPNGPPGGLGGPGGPGGPPPFDAPPWRGPEGDGPSGLGPLAEDAEDRPLPSPGGPRRFEEQVFACVGMPVADGLVGVGVARAQLGASMFGALVLFGLALAAIAAGRREARLRTEIERRQRLVSLGQLGATLAHEIRTPLAAVRGFAQLLLERVDPDNERVSRPTRKIVEETGRLERLVEALLSYARPAAPSFARLDLAELATNGAERLASLAVEGGATLLCDAAEPVLVDADGDRLVQVLDNLVRNAIAASPAGQPVTIRVWTERQQVHLEVLDRGPGVPAAERDAIFEPFHTTRADGTGLGLAVARRIADEHGGTLAVLDREGGGARFRLTLPRRQATLGRDR